jgi:hypothetical protein
VNNRSRLRRLFYVSKGARARHQRNHPRSQGRTHIDENFRLSTTHDTTLVPKGFLFVPNNELVDIRTQPKEVEQALVRPVNDPQIRTRPLDCRRHQSAEHHIADRPGVENQSRRLKSPSHFRQCEVISRIWRLAHIRRCAARFALDFSNIETESLCGIA